MFESGGTPYPIPAGASDHPLGGLGFANWIREVAEQERQLGVFFDTVIVCTVTGSTHAGMIAGTALESRGDWRIIGIDASKTLAKMCEQVSRIARATAEKIGVDRELRDDEVTSGPLRREESEFAQWAPSDDDASAVQAFLAATADQL